MWSSHVWKLPFDMQRSSLPNTINKPIYLPENTPRRVWELDSAMASEEIVEIDVALEPKRSQQDSIGGLSVCKIRPMYTCTI